MQYYIQTEVTFFRLSFKSKLVKNTPVKKYLKNLFDNR